MKVLSWNVNGFRAVLNKGFISFVDAFQPDILMLQETKAGGDIQVSLPGYLQYWCNAKKKGYAGTAVFTKERPVSSAYGLGMKAHDDGGRVITLEYGAYYLVNVYTPNSGRGLPRHAYRQQWDSDFLSYIRRLEQKKPVVFGGDLNVAHQEIDLANPKENKRNAGFTAEERAGFDQLIIAGFIDTFREFNNEPGQYTWWGMWNNLRQRNIGWRVDYFLISHALRHFLKDAFILSKVRGSDHCPVGIELIPLDQPVARDAQK